MLFLPNFRKGILIGVITAVVIPWLFHYFSERSKRIDEEARPDAVSAPAVASETSPEAASPPRTRGYNE